MSEENIEVVRRAHETFNSHDVEGLVALAHPDCEWLPFRAQLEGITYRGHEGVRQFVRDMDADWKSFRIDPLEFHDRGDSVAVVGHVSAVGSGGAAIDSDAGFLFGLRDGRILTIVSHSDPAAALEELG
jgi:ketosteroid isomerase-like protein